jgi:hypothetical protein
VVAGPRVGRVRVGGGARWAGKGWGRANDLMGR